MKRLILAVAGTIAGLIALLSFRTHPGAAAIGSLPAATLGPGPSLVTPSARTGAAAGPGPSPASGGPDAGSLPGRLIERALQRLPVAVGGIGGAGHRVYVRALRDQCALQQQRPSVRVDQVR